MNPIKLIVTSKQNIVDKYGSARPIHSLLQKMVTADKLKQIDTRIVYIDDKVSAERHGIKPVKQVDMEQCKKAIDALFRKHKPAYIMIFGAQDIIPFQALVNLTYAPRKDPDKLIPSDLPYACENPYSDKISDFVGPTRVVSRFPDLYNQADISYVEKLIDIAIGIKPKKADKYKDYFGITCDIWKGSSTITIEKIFGSTAQLLIAPPSNSPYTKQQLKAPIHFFNCHGNSNDFRYFGQHAQTGVIDSCFQADNLLGKVSKGTVVAAECCYGAELVDSQFLASDTRMGIANTYLAEGACCMVGSTTIAYGPAEGQDLADFMVQFFIQEILAGASVGRAFLQTRQKFLDEVGPALNMYEYKTFAQFILLGDPAVQPVKPDQTVAKSLLNPTFNNRIQLFNKGTILQQTVPALTKKVVAADSKPDTVIAQALKQRGFTDYTQNVYQVQASRYQTKSVFESAAVNGGTTYRSFVSSTESKDLATPLQIKVIVVKEIAGKPVSVRYYVSK